MDLGAIALRGTIGPLFVGHGTQKLFGWFGGHGPDGTGGWFESLGLRPGRRHAVAAGTAEALGGTLLTLGMLTPVATSALTATMTTAIRTAHRGKGPWVTEGGYEYPLVLIGALTSLAYNGPGQPSVDAGRFRWMSGPAWAGLSLAAGVAGSYLATSDRTAEMLSPAERAPEPVTPAEQATRDREGRFVERQEEAQPAAAGAQ